MKNDALDFVKRMFYVYILQLSDCEGRFMVSIHLSLLFSHWFWPSLCYPSYISLLIMNLFLFWRQTSFVSSVRPVHISGNQNQSRSRSPTSHQPGVNSGGLVVLIHIPWYIFLFKFEISLKCEPKSTLLFSSFTFSILCPQHFTASQKTLPCFSQI